MILRNVFLTLALGLGIAFTLVFQTDRFFSDRLIKNQESQMRSQALIIKGGIEREIKELLRQGGGLLENRQADLSDKMPYKMIGKANLVNGVWTITEQKFAEQKHPSKSKIEQWAASYVQLAMQTLRWKDFEDTQQMAVSIFDPQKNPYLLVVGGERESKTFLLLGTSLFQKWNEVQSGLLQQAYLITQAGQVLAHPMAEYVGSVFTEDSLISELSSNGPGSGSRMVSRGDGKKMLAVFERIQGTNIYVVTEANSEVLLKPLSANRWEMILISAGLIVIALGLVILSNRTEEKIVPTAPSVTVADVQPSPIDKSIFEGLQKLNESEVLQLKWRAVQETAAAFCLELRSKFSGILSATHMARTSKEDLGKIILDIEKSARDGRELIQKLEAISGEAETVESKAQFSTVVESSLRMVSDKLKMKGIEVRTEIEETPISVFSSDFLLRILGQLYVNAIDAMERMGQKRLTVIVKNEEASVTIRIIDTGNGISQSQLSILETHFFMSKGDGRLGLGFPMIKGMVERLGGKFKIDSSGHQGTEVSLSLPLRNPEQIVSSSSASQVAREVPVAPMKGSLVPSLDQSSVSSSQRGKLSDRIELQKMELFSDSKIEDLLTPPTLETEEKRGARKASAPMPEIEGLNLDFIDREVLDKRTPPAPIAPVRPSINVSLKQKVIDTASVKIRKPGARL